MNRLTFLKLTLTLLAATIACPVDAYVEEPVHTNVFVSGTYGYNTYRIPSIVGLDDGTLLAFAEGRKNSSTDSGDIDIVLCRSTDNGASWTSPQLVWSNGTGVAGNPCPVVDQATGNVLLISNHQTAGVDEGDIRQGVGERTYQVQTSSDSGLTWTAPTQIMAIEAIDPYWLAGGPNHGLQLQRGDAAGRIVIAGNHSVYTTVTSYPARFTSNELHTIYSDDGGLTWELGAVSGETGNIYVSEVAATELPDGSLYFTIRDQHGAAVGTRAFETSHDAGESFDGVLQMDPTAVAPVCQGSILEFSAVDLGDTEDRVLMSYPGSATTRENITVRSSFDSCQTWNSGRVVYDGLSAYSDIVRTVDDQVGLLYERDNYSKITFASFSTEWLDEGSVITEDPGPWLSDYADAILADSPLAYYRMDEAFGNYLHDASGNDLHGMLTGSEPTTYAVARPLALDSNNGAMEFNMDTTFSVTDAGGLLQFGTDRDFAIELWFKTDGLPEGETVMGFLSHGDTNGSYWLRNRLDPTFQACLDYGNTADTVEANSDSLDGQWHHLVMNVDRDAFSRLYVDGQLIGEMLELLTGDLSTTLPLLIGSQWGYSGLMDELAIYGAALTEQQIAAHYALGTPAIPGDANGDGVVDGSDVTILAGNWQAGVGDSEATVTWAMGDFNGDGVIDGSDVTILAGNWQHGVEAAASAVPEPNTIVLILTALLAAGLAPAFGATKRNRRAL